MNTFALAAAADELATRDPAVFGYGYADSQHPWRHDPAFDLGRSACLELLARVCTVASNHGTVVQIGLGARPGRHLALRWCAARVVTIDADAARIAALRAATTIDPAHDVLLCGDPLGAEVLDQLAHAAPECDVLLLDGADSYEGVRALWQRHAARVRVGGLLAIVDRSQDFAAVRHRFDVDRFAADLERDHLWPHGVRMQRLGGALAVHWYTQSAGTRANQSGQELPAGFVPAVRSRRVALGEGYSFHDWQGAIYALPGEDAVLCPRRLERNDYPLVLRTSDLPAAERLVRAWRECEPRLECARRQLGADDAAGAAATVRAVGDAYPWLALALVGCLEVVPWNRALLLAQGLLGLFLGPAREGISLLRRALRLEWMDGELLRTVAAAYLRVLVDEPGARALLAESRQHLRVRKAGEYCHSHRREHVLWHFPQLLANVRGVIHVGAHRGETVDAWSCVGVGEQLHVEANPGLFAELEHACRAVRHGRARALSCAVGARPGAAVLRHGTDTARGSLFPTHALASAGALPPQTCSVAVEVRTLDALVHEGAIDPRAYDLLFVDAEGSELEVLRGAEELLRHVDVVGVTVLLQPVYEGAPMPEAIQAFLREVDDGVRFGLRAFEPSRCGTRGSAVFRRLKARGQRR